MAPVPTYDPPHVQLGKLMVEARRRGLSFEEWWAEAVRPAKPLVMTNSPSPPAGAVRWPSDRADRQTWQAAIRDSKDGWRRAFERAEPTSQERALTLLAPVVEAMAESPDRVDAGADGHVPERGIAAQGAVASAG